MTFLPKPSCASSLLRFRRLYSFIGKQPILVDASVKIEISPIIDDSSKTFKRTEYATLVRMDGPLGAVSFPIVKGLVVSHKLNTNSDPTLAASADTLSTDSSREQELFVSLDLDRSLSGQKVTKYQEKFVKSMWGTTQKLLSNFAIGITEVGYSHFTQIPIPAGISAGCTSPTRIEMKGVDKQQLHIFAAKLRSIRKPEPYKGKGIFFLMSSPSVISESKVSSLISSLIAPKERDHSLLELSKIRESYEPLPFLLWSNPAVVSVLLFEVISIYPLLNQSTLAAAISTRVCNALALMQCLASHSETRIKFIQAQLPLYLYPILSSTSRSRPFEYLRLTSLGIIGALVKHDSSDVIKFLINTEAIPICLRIMETGNELCKTVAIFIIQKTLLDEYGLSFLCQSYDHLYLLISVLNVITVQLVEMPSTRLLKHVVRCYLRLSENPK
ncbi:hypothetical protein DI09_3p340 [Mitosporidium daphniae]|uniref:Large ribosomal subunit protein uL6 alpha-beta domain-containing protein n=1 Tax=Mitosporidium daphniae TaxID=1485682 RepID=A0A098VQF6_9MICR|nr:uncharacterized protein DI09_3p340 [Mitosporidium daphniae]KGG51272.1 hypothetical protein DI09_3p340 [Mitosporidium daphniae]|eukprot:XP_013237699.1 uncharacterized protein DI09_3p340 [Mitosporidium daphniae]